MKDAFGPRTFRADLPY